MGERGPAAVAINPMGRSAAEISPDQMLAAAVSAVRHGDESLVAMFETMPVPIYLTDADGWITFFNRACVDFAGRRPVPGQDRWCVTWRLYTENGVALPHDQCPMAVAIRECRPVRGVTALAERPDGTRVMFVPYPTPLIDEHGVLTGAVNILIDVTDQRQAAALKAQADRCHRLARSITDQRTIETLTLMARDYEEKARALVA